ncbi:MULTISPECIES: NAD(P)H-dependent oxidoreductase [unclassified Mycoplasma]|uniref:NAD(P)H-dependent oxidoreductase n=1 Tax=unclassified Mycoplasma TaxID=2683645 RepID=UPI00216B20C4|nr:MULTISPECIES: NAD(P)H-dependent oxidoreductase [unclassified Mycoplasma]MCS4537137.1 NAD(P)H-dependent oxidoreductase [Mycoplasma sp. CSL7475-4]MCT4469893.1 NAD(P)H-dependent oxidoreductase [Mycoplasma sp. HS2188]
MKKTIFIDGSFFTNETSYTTALMNEFHEALGKPERINLTDSVFNRAPLSQSNIATYWGEVDGPGWINKLKETDLLVLSSTVVNFTVPSLVKNFIDAISIADLSFSYKLSTDGNPVGLLKNLNVILVTSQGGPQQPGVDSIQVKWLRSVFNFLGAKSVNFIEVNGTKMPDLINGDTAKYAKTRVDEFKKLVDSL